MIISKYCDRKRKIRNFVNILDQQGRIFIWYDMNIWNKYRWLTVQIYSRYRLQCPLNWDWWNLKLLWSLIIQALLDILFQNFYLKRRTGKYSWKVAFRNPKYQTLVVQLPYEDLFNYLRILYHGGYFLFYRTLGAAQRVNFIDFSNNASPILPEGLVSQLRFQYAGN